MTDQKSIEQALIKISLRSLYFLASALIVCTAFAVMLYGNIMDGQKDIIVEVRKNAAERVYQIEGLRKDLNGLENRVIKLEK